ncbi:H(+)/Cl(-) exchange transporter 7-like isoform X2 [Lineus longissimus]|uniref:H(+)/Cl(-) exchange transporter 7-like isoform X2 n=1 Tax=Lineus longissimus TaxID=88925 RepID=UPI00315DFD83
MDNPAFQEDPGDPADDDRLEFTVTPATLDIEPDANHSRSSPGTPLIPSRSLSVPAPNRHSSSTNNLTSLLYPSHILEEGDSDSLTQTSVTRLLGRKFRSAANYELLKIQEQQEQEKREKQKLKRVRPKKRLVSKFESLDYDICENKLWQKEQEKLRSLKVQRIWLARWFVMVLVGFCTAGVASFIEASIHFIADWKFTAITYLIEQTIEKSTLIIPLLVWAAINMACVLLGSLLVTIVAPAATGSGIPHIKCFLNGVKIKGLLSLKCLVAKALGVVLSIVGGLACGKEGPMIHSGAIVAGGVSQGRCKLCNVDFKVFEFFRTDHERRDFISGGAAAGVAAAFGAPVGGLLFSLEEGASFWNQSLTWRIVVSSMIATFTVNVLLSAINGHAGDLTYPGLVSFGLFPNITYQIIELPIFLAMAIFGGLTGALFNYANIQLAVFRKRFINKNVLKIVEAVVVAGVSAIVSFILLYAINDCQLSHFENKTEHEHKTQMFCPEGHYNTLSRLLLRSPESSLKIMLHDPPEAYSVLTLSIFMILYYLLAMWTYGLSVSSGIFIPSLLIGATWGRLVGIGITSAFPSMSHNIGKYALIGAACQLGGIVRMTISLTVILVECTGDIRFGLPIMMVLIIAKWTGDFFNQGLYDMHIQLLGIPILPWDPPELSSNITAEKIMSMPVVAFQETELVGNILDTLLEVTHNGFPVVQVIQSDISDESYGKLKGFILRSQLTFLLKKRAFTNHEGECFLKKELKPQNFRDDYPRHTKLSDITIKEEERDYTIDLTPYMNPVPYTARQNVSLPRIFKLFRGLGLRHLVVVDEDNEVVGIVSRKDLARYRQITRRLGLEVDKLDIIDS